MLGSGWCCGCRPAGVDGLLIGGIWVMGGIGLYWHRCYRLGCCLNRVCGSSRR